MWDPGSVTILGSENCQSIDLFRGACAVRGNVPVAGHVKRVDRGDAFDASPLTGRYFILQFDFSWAKLM